MTLWLFSAGCYIGPYFLEWFKNLFSGILGMPILLFCACIKVCAYKVQCWWFYFWNPNLKGLWWFCQDCACLPLPQTLKAHTTVCSFGLLSPPKPSQDDVAGVPSVSLGTWAQSGPSKSLPKPLSGGKDTALGQEPEPGGSYAAVSRTPDIPAAGSLTPGPWALGSL